MGCLVQRLPAPGYVLQRNPTAGIERILCGNYTCCLLGKHRSRTRGPDLMSQIREDRKVKVTPNSEVAYQGNFECLIYFQCHLLNVLVYS